MHIIDYICLAFYIIEVIIKLIGYGIREYFRDY